MYRDEQDPTIQTCNIFVDPRIYRGMTFARRSILTDRVEPIPSYRDKVVSRTIGEVIEPEVKYRDGLSDAPVQTDPQEGEIEIIKNESSIAIQTDPYRDLPVLHRKPPAVRSKGVRTEVQGTDLFDFNEEVKPFVQTLVQKALETAYMEVREEEELAMMNKYLRAFEQQANTEAAAIARLEAEEQQKFDAKEKLLKERLAIEQAQLALREKVLARGFAEYFSWDIAEDVIAHLDSHGYFYDETEREIEEQFLPWLTQSVLERINQKTLAENISEEVLREAQRVCDTRAQNVENQTEGHRQQTVLTRQQILRLLIKEDVVSRAVMLKRKLDAQKPAPNPEEEDVEGDAQTEDTYDTYQTTE